MNRVESFSDGVIAVIITIMVLELKVPTDGTLASLEKMAPQFLAYLLSYLTVGIIWANHHHLLKGALRPDSKLIWSNNSLLFWMSLIPFVTAYLAANPGQPFPVAAYGVVMAMMGLGFTHLRQVILKQRYASCGDVSRFQNRMQLKNVLSSAGYAAGIGFAFINVWVSYAFFVAIPASYFLPDPSLAVDEPKAGG